MDKMKCLNCKEVEYKRAKDNPLIAECPKCGNRMPNGDGKIKFRGRPPKEAALEPDHT
jgi:hypothetical protein